MSSAVALPRAPRPRFRPADAPLRGAAARGPGRVSARAPSSAPRAGGAAPAPDRPKAKVAVFVSGGGSNLRALHAAMLDGRVHAEVVAVVSNKPDCGGVSWAEDLGIPTLAYPPKKTDADGLTPDDLVHQLVDVHGAEYVCLAGYLRLIPPELCRAYERRMLNIHPALLPAFGGKGMHGHHVHEAVVASGARFSGPTVHFVNEKFDEGKILAQRVVPVRAGIRRRTSPRGCSSRNTSRSRTRWGRSWTGGSCSGGRGAVHRGGGRVKRRIRGGMRTERYTRRAVSGVTGRRDGTMRAELRRRPHRGSSVPHSPSARFGILPTFRQTSMFVVRVSVRFFEPSSGLKS